MKPRFGPKPSIRGRRRFFDPQKKVEFCNLVDEGASVEQAAEAMDVSLRTVEREAKRDEDFDHELRLAQRSTPDPFKLMKGHARTHWRAAAWLLERTDPDRYAKRPASSASPEQFEQALVFVLEAALEAIAPDQRAAVYKHVQAACDEAFNCVFPNFGPWDRRRPTSLPATPLADGEHLKRVRDPSGPYVIPDYDDETAPREPLALWEASPTPIPRSNSTDGGQPAVVGVKAPSRKEIFDRLASWKRRLRTAPPAQPQRRPAVTTASTDPSPILSPKMRFATEFDRSDKRAAELPHSTPPPDPVK
jgi:hypothetical protein